MKYLRRVKVPTNFIHTGFGLELDRVRVQGPKETSNRVHDKK